MGELSNIQWCDSTWNPWRGCDKVNELCKNCYITTTVPFRTSGQKHGDPRVRAGEATLRAPHLWSNKPCVCNDCGATTTGQVSVSNLGGMVCDECNSLNVHRRRVFCLSLGDWLDDKVPVEWLSHLLQTVNDTPNIDWLLVSKRYENWKDRLIESVHNVSANAWVYEWIGGKPPHNIWLGCSVGQSNIDDLEVFSRIPAQCRFLSCEPLLEPLDLSGWLYPEFRAEDQACAFDWVIVGGESGPNARPCDIESIRSVKDQCAAAGVPVFVKQLGSNPVMEPGPIPVVCEHRKGGDPDEWPEDLRVRQFPTI